jgi:proline iminopeptidase
MVIWHHGNATLKNWDVRQTNQPSYLSIGSKYDTMDPEHMKWIANEVQNGRFAFFHHLCSTMTKTYFPA